MKCQVVFRAGPLKGLRCGKKAVDGLDYCRRHSSPWARGSTVISQQVKLKKENDSVSADEK